MDMKLLIQWTVSPGQPSSISDDADVFTLVGSGHDAADLVNQKEIHWGVSQQCTNDICTPTLCYNGVEISFTEVAFL